MTSNQENVGVCKQLLIAESTTSIISALYQHAQHIIGGMASGAPGPSAAATCRDAL
jgi:hypothetical protein